MRQRPIPLALAACLLSATAYLPATKAGEPVEVSAPTPVDASPATLLRAADQALQGNRLVEAQALLDRLPPVGSDTETDLLRAELLVAQGRPVEARSLLAGLRPLRDDRLQCRALSAEIITATALLELAAADELLRQQPVGCSDDPVFLRAVGRLEIAHDRPEAAADALGKALRLQPGNAALGNDLAVALITAGRPADAARLLSTLLNGDEAAQPEMRINLDFANGMMGQAPARNRADNDVFWSRRLQYAGLGAYRGGRRALAEALLAQALNERPSHDPQLWRQYTDMTGKMEGKGQ